VSVDWSGRPLAASFIVTNHFRVAIACFAGGVFLGVGSLVLLAYNGLAMGTFAGHFANQGLLGYLLEFIVGHGVLELFAIWVAGAAGFLLGKSIVAPGDRSRTDALVMSGRVAVRMMRRRRAAGHRRVDRGFLPWEAKGSGGPRPARPASPPPTSARGALAPRLTLAGSVRIRIASFSISRNPVTSQRAAPR
jgi:hypothetical protein